MILKRPKTETFIEWIISQTDPLLRYIAGGKAVLRKYEFSQILSISPQLNNIEISPLVYKLSVSVPKAFKLFTASGNIGKNQQEKC